MTGQRHGRLVVLSRHPDRGRDARWIAQCDCGSPPKSFLGGHLRRGLISSCGCIQRMHGHTRGGAMSPTFSSWQAMKQRCINPKNQAWDRYGGRGIRVCPVWLDSFDAFLLDMGPRPTGTWIERINNDGNYEPSNCCWATPTQQGRNRRSNKRIVVNGESLVIAAAIERSSLSPHLVRKRLRVGWSIDRALTESATSRKPVTHCQGSNHYGAKLNDDLVRDIRLRLSLGEQSTTVAAELGVSGRTVRDAAARRTWRHVA